jgi:hypothetical protein
MRDWRPARSSGPFEMGERYLEQPLRRLLYALSVNPVLNASEPFAIQIPSRPAATIYQPTNHQSPISNHQKRYNRQSCVNSICAASFRQPCYR